MNPEEIKEWLLEQSQINLDSCPFCGEDIFMTFSYIKPDNRVKACCVCGAEGPLRENEKEAAKAWNTRAGEKNVCT